MAREQWMEQNLQKFLEGTLPNESNKIKAMVSLFYDKNRQLRLLWDELQTALAAIESKPEIFIAKYRQLLQSATSMLFSAESEVFGNDDVALMFDMLGRYFGRIAITPTQRQKFSAITNELMVFPNVFLDAHPEYSLIRGAALSLPFFANGVLNPADIDWEAKADGQALARYYVHDFAQSPASYLPFVSALQEEIRKGKLSINDERVKIIINDERAKIIFDSCFKLAFGDGRKGDVSAKRNDRLRAGDLRRALNGQPFRVQLQQLEVYLQYVLLNVGPEGAPLYTYTGRLLKNYNPLTSTQQKHIGLLKEVYLEILAKNIDKLTDEDRQAVADSNLVNFQRSNYKPFQTTTTATRKSAEQILKHAGPIEAKLQNLVTLYEQRNIPELNNAIVRFVLENDCEVLNSLNKDAQGFLKNYQIDKNHDFARYFMAMYVKCAEYQVVTETMLAEDGPPYDIRAHLQQRLHQLRLELSKDKKDSKKILALTDALVNRRSRFSVLSPNVYPRKALCQNPDLFKQLLEMIPPEVAAMVVASKIFESQHWGDNVAARDELALIAKNNKPVGEDTKPYNYPKEFEDLKTRFQIIKARLDLGAPSLRTATEIRNLVSQLAALRNKYTTDDTLQKNIADLLHEVNQAIPDQLSLSTPSVTESAKHLAQNALTQSPLDTIKEVFDPSRKSQILQDAKNISSPGAKR